jgi:DNA-binding CsgD family transcriptional regulator
VLNLVAPLLGTGVAGPEAAAIFEAAAAEALPEQPGLSAALYGAAAAAGRPVSFLAARWAEAAALAGDLTTALRLADAVIAGPRRPEQADCALVAAAALAHRGQLDRTAELYQWAGVGPAPAFAAVASIGAGRLVEAPPDIDPGPDVPPPSLLNGAATLMARGLRESVTEPASAALSSLVAACDLLEPVGRAVLLPDSPAALAAVVGVHSGEPATARGVLDRAMGARLGGAVMAARHQLLQAWILMADGETVAARQWLPSGRDTLAARDRLFALAIDVGLARRDSDLAGLRQGWAVACEHLPGHPIDLFSLLPLGELLVTAGRLGEQTRIAGQLDEAWSLLARLGDPPLWTAPLHWSSLHAAVASGRREVAEGHAAALAAGAEQGGRLAGALAAGAESWVALAGGGIDAVRVSAAARLLHDTGLSWDAARLAGQAAIRTPDRDAMVALLECARQLRRRPSRGGGQNGAAADATRSPVLSDREVEVADLVLAGLTYRQIGDRLFISPKTVEHHVARIRQRLGCTSRRDLLTTLRGLGITNAR